MRGWLHPEGAEGARTYWMRRVALLVCVAAVLALVVSIGLLGAKDDPHSGRRPAVTQNTGPRDIIISAPGQSVAGRDAPRHPLPATQGMSGTAASGSGAAGATGESAPAGQQGKGPETAGRPGGAQGAAAQTRTEPAQWGGDASRLPSPSAQPGPGQGEQHGPDAAPSCDPRLLTTSLTGNQRVRSGSEQQLQVMLTNGAAGACTLIIAPPTFTVVVYSGSDRIWSTEDCAAWLPSSTTRLEPGKTVSFNVAWPTRRSAGTCDLRPDYLQPGTYVARAQLKGAERANLIMTLHG